MPRWLNRNVWTLSWVSFLQDAASEMLYPIMPILLSTILNAPAAVIGAIEGLAEGTAAATKLLSSRINRFLPRKTMVFLGYFGAGLGKLIVAAAGAWPLVLLGRVTDRLGKGLRSAPRDSLLVEGTDKSHRGRIIGFHRTADTLGAVLGPLLALGLLAAFDNQSQKDAIRTVLWFTVIPALASTLLVLAVKDSGSRSFAQAKVSNSANSKGSDTPADLKKVLIAVAAFSLANFPDALILLRLSEIGFTVQGVIEAYLLYNVVYAIFNFPAGWLADRIQPKYVFALGLVIFALAYGGLGTTSDKGMSLGFVVIYGLFAAVNDTVGKSWISKLAPDHKQLWAQSMLQGFSGFGVLISGILAGLFWTTGSGFVLPFVVSAGVALAAAGVVASLRTK